MPLNNLFALLQQASEDCSGHGIIVYHPGGRSNGSSFSTYNNLYQGSLSRARHLQSLKELDTNLVVLLYFDDHFDNLKWFWAIIAIGGVPCISPPLSKDIDQRKKYIRTVQKLLDNPLIITTKTLVAEFCNLPGLRIRTVNEIESEEASLVHDQAFSGTLKREDDLAFLMLTSGSTGDPKAVCLQHGQIQHSLRGKSEIHNTTKDDIFMNWTGLDHVAGLAEIHLHALSLVASQVHIPGADFLEDPIRFLEKIDKHKISYTFAPNFFLASLVRNLESSKLACRLEERHVQAPTMYGNPGSPNACERFEDAPTFNLSSLTALISGGEGNVVKTCQKLTMLLQEHIAPASFIRPGFGMTETCARAIYTTRNCPAYDSTRKTQFASLGSCITGIHMRVTRPDGTKASINEIGTPHWSGPAVFKKYYNNIAATTSSFTVDGWFNTRDLAMIDPNGRLHLAGRDKDNLIINGVNHYPQAIEEAIEAAEIPGLTPSYTAVFHHRPEDSETEALSVVYLPTYKTIDVTNRVSTAASISKAVMTCCGALPCNIIPLELSLLPKSSLGKLSRSKIRQAFEGGAYLKHQESNEKIIHKYLEITYEPPTTKTQRMVLDSYNEIFPSNVGKVGINEDLFQAGVDSIEILKLRMRLQKKLRFDIPLTIFFAHPIVRDVALALDSLQRKMNYDPVVVLQAAGSKTPIWFIHPGVGEVLIFMNIARYFADRPGYALRARGFDGEKYFENIPEMVSTYHNAIKGVQSQGPYALAGYSFGSILAFEVTKIMEAKGDMVKFLGVFDQPPYFKQRARSYDWYEVVLTIASFLGLVQKQSVYKILPSVRKLSNDEVITYIFATAPPSRLEELGICQERLGNWANLAYQLKVIAWDYDPLGTVTNMDVFYTGPLVGIVQANTMEEWFDRHISKWREFVREEPKFHVVGGCHRSMLSPRNVMDFQKLLKDSLRERGL